MRFYHGLTIALMVASGFYIGCFLVWQLAVAVFGA